MTRDESEREDLMREATALAERIEFTVPEFSEPLLIGFRANGSGSLFVGQDPVYHFNAQHQLRRAYIQGRLIKAERGELVALVRSRTPSATLLLRQELDAVECKELLQVLRDTTERLASQIANGQVHVRGQVPPDAPVLQRVIRWLATLQQSIAIAARPGL